MTRLTRCLALLMFVAAAGSAAAAPVVEYELGRGVMARLNNDGRVEIGALSASAWYPVLRVSWPQTLPAGMEIPAPLTAVLQQSGTGEHSENHKHRDDGEHHENQEHCDDDERDEFREFGHEVGEDLATPYGTDDAITGCVVGLWDLAIGDRGRRVETRHWAHEHLSSKVVASYEQRGGGIIESLRISLMMPGTWVPLGEVCEPARHFSDVPQFIANIADPRQGEPALWVGVALPDSQPRRRSEQRVRINRADLIVPPLDAGQVLILVVGPTRLRVLEDLVQAVNVHEVDIETGLDRRSRWTLLTNRRGLSGELPTAARLRPEAHGRFSVVFDLRDEQARFWDPDLFRIAGQVLGPADRLIWSDDIGRSVSIAWSGDGAGWGIPCLPYEALGARGSGTLEIHFAGPLPFSAVESEDLLLEAVHQDGRRGAFPIILDTRTLPGILDGETREAADDRELKLSPALLVSSPNPFHRATQITFQVPATMGEAFIHEEGSRPVFDSQQRMPYADGAASVMVTVYNLEGRELTTLFAGIASVGVYETSWDGRDREGRTLPSGTYFCRLQIEKWSITRRLVFIR